MLEFANLRFRVLALTLVARLLPDHRAVPIRLMLLRAMGLQIGPGTRFATMPVLQSSRAGPLGARFRVGANCSIGVRTILEFGEVLTLGDRVTLANGAVILTTTHELGPRERRAGDTVRAPVTIGNDVTIGENAIILPGANIGDRAEVLANSVVNGVVAAGTIVNGIPARPLRPK